MPSDWKTAAAAKRAAILELIPPAWRLAEIPDSRAQKDVTGDYIEQFLTQEEKTITRTDAVGVAENVAAGKWTALAVTDAFCHRAAIAHQLLNCLHEIFFDAARADAKALDDYFIQNGRRTKGPLHGVPVSLKDQFHVRNVETTMGYVGWIGTFEGQKDNPNRLTFESEMVRELRECGAILYCKTSVPHTLMSGETINNIIGYTWNPRNRYLSSGGSSGGEGALIGIRGSPIGLGSDIGGSIRIPAAFNGLYGLRPTSGRLPYRGTANSMDGQNSVLSVLGPIATTARSMRLMMKALLSTNPWEHDPLVVDMPWRSAEEEAVRDMLKQGSPKLTFGLFKSDGVVNVHPPVARAIDMVIDVLRAAGHNFIEWKPPSHEHGIALVGKSWMYDGGADVHGAFALSGEEPSKNVTFLYGNEVKPGATAVEIAANNVAKRSWQEQYADYWNSTASQTETGRPVDAVISPLAPFAAARPGTYTYYAYSSWVNGLDYTSVVVPVTNADKTMDKKLENVQALNETDRFVRDLYDADIYDGAHVSIQLVGRRYTEEKMITIAEYVGSLLGK